MTWHPSANAIASGVDSIGSGKVPGPGVGPNTLGIARALRSNSSVARGVYRSNPPGAKAWGGLTVVSTGHRSPIGSRSIRTRSRNRVRARASHRTEPACRRTRFFSGSGHRVGLTHTLRGPRGRASVGTGGNTKAQTKAQRPRDHSRQLHRRGCAELKRESLAHLKLDAAHDRTIQDKVQIRSIQRFLGFFG